jgi:hypothetical protein
MNDKGFADLKLRSLEAQNIQSWRDGLPEELRASSRTES